MVQHMFLLCVSQGMQPPSSANSRTDVQLDSTSAATLPWWLENIPKSQGQAAQFKHLALGLER